MTPAPCPHGYVPCSPRDATKPIPCLGCVAEATEVGLGQVLGRLDWLGQRVEQVGRDLDSTLRVIRDHCDAHRQEAQEAGKLIRCIRDDGKLWGQRLDRQLQDLAAMRGALAELVRSRDRKQLTLRWRLGGLVVRVGGWIQTGKWPPGVVAKL